jgi:hypothetical protein
MLAHPLFAGFGGLHRIQVIAKIVERDEMQGVWSAAPETYQIGRRRSEQHATPQIARSAILAVT